MTADLRKAEAGDIDELKKLWQSYLNGEELLWGRIYAIYVFLLWYDLKF